MAAPQLTRSILLSSRRTPSLFRISSLPTRCSLQCRIFHQSSPINNDAEPAEVEKPKKRGKAKGSKPKEPIRKLREDRIVSVEPEDEGEIHPKVSFDYNRPDIPCLDLPPLAEWKQVFKSVHQSRLRPTVRNPDTAMMLAEKFVPEGSRDKIIIEASSGPGQLSRALLQLPRERIKKLIIIESVPTYFKYLESLKQVDDRVTVINLEGRDWSTYATIRELGILDDVQITDWDEVHPQLQFIMQMGGGVDAEQVASQLLRTIPDRQWLFKYGRIPLNLILTDRMYERLMAPEDLPGKKPNNIRCKVSVMAQAVADIKEVVPYNALQPYSQHFHPERFRVEDSGFSPLDKRKPGNPRVAIEVMPFKHPLIKPGDLDFWDYVVRKLFVVKATPMAKALSSLGPGANNLLKIFTESKDSEKAFDMTKSPRQFNLQEWNWVVEVFKAWPFRPTNLGIEQMFAKKV